MLKNAPRCQSGVSLIELMIGVAVGLIVIAATVASYVVIARSGSEILASAKLNAELRATMDMMVRDIRRAGSWTATFADREDGSNPFTRRSGGLITDVNILGSGGVIEFSYNGSFLGSTNGTVFGYRRDDNAVKTLQCNISSSQPHCNTGSIVDDEHLDWMKITDDNNIVITSLTFRTTGSRCLNLTQLTDPGSNWEVEEDPDPSAPPPYCPRLRPIDPPLFRGHQ